MFILYLTNIRFLQFLETKNSKKAEEEEQNKKIVKRKFFKNFSNYLKNKKIKIFPPPPNFLKSGEDKQNFFSKFDFGGYKKISTHTKK